MKELEEEIRAFYESKVLTDEQLELIEHQTEAKKDQWISISYISQYAAVLVLLAAALYSLVILPGQQRQDTVERFAKQIVFNHEKQLPLEIQTSSVVELNEKMNKLDFKIVLPPRITDNLKLKGGRYCSVDNRIAAQLKLENAQGKIVTCYIFRKAEQFDFDDKIHDKDTEVDFWDNGTTIFALATDLD